MDKFAADGQHELLSPGVRNPVVGAQFTGCLRSPGIRTLVLRCMVAGTLYVPVPEAQEVYSLARLSSNKAKDRVSTRISLLSLRDPDV
jgi:hypothetical protein